MTLAHSLRLNAFWQYHTGLESPITSLCWSLWHVPYQTLSTKIIQRQCADKFRCMTVPLSNRHQSLRQQIHQPGDEVERLTRAQCDQMA